MIPQYIIVFLVTALLDACWTLYFISVNKQQAFQSAIWSSVIMLGGGYIVLEYNRTPLLLLSAVLGAFVGTFITIKIKQNGSKDSTDSKS